MNKYYTETRFGKEDLFSVRKIFKDGKLPVYEC